MGCASGRSIDRSSLRGGEVDASVYMPARAGWIERLELKGGAAERLRHHGTRNDRAEGEPLIHLDTRSRDQPDQRRRAANRANSQRPVHAWATMCSSPRSPLWSVDSNLWAMVSAPPRAPGPSNTARSAPRAKRWYTGGSPPFSSAKPIDSTNSWAGCMRRFV